MEGKDVHRYASHINRLTVFVVFCVLAIGCTAAVIIIYEVRVHDELADRTEEHDKTLKIILQELELLKSASSVGLEPLNKHAIVKRSLQEISSEEQDLSQLSTTWLRGPPGRDGKDGKDGKDGRDGLNGKDGRDGLNGKDGKDAINCNLSPMMIPVNRSGLGMSYNTAKNCDEIRQAGYPSSGIYQIKLRNKYPLDVWCDMEAAKGWITIQRRVDGSVDFYRGWEEYKKGFGSVEHEFWLGLEAIHILTQQPTKLRVKLEAWNGEWKSGVYSKFSVAGEAEKYRLTISDFSSFDGLVDDLQHHSSMAFTTYDRDNDVDGGNCAIIYKGGWWYRNCHVSNLNGVYYQGGNTTSFATGAVWKNWKGYYYSYKAILMEIAPA